MVSSKSPSKRRNWYFDEDDFKAMLGKHIIYSPSFVSYDNQIQVEKPIYKVKTLSEKDYEGRSFKELGITEQFVQEIVVFNQSNKQWVPKERRMIGMVFIVRDRNTLIAGRNADDFELVRVKQDK